jgi:hypothetical protein
MRAIPLRQFQDSFARALLETELPARHHDPALAHLVAQPGFAVYRNTVMKGCIDALQANYPSVARLVGEEWFRAAAAIFVRTHLPSHPALVEYGAGFAAFLARFEPATGLPYLPGIARLDRFWTEAHIAPDQAPIRASDVAALAPGSLSRTILRPHASARWAWFETEPILSIWRRNRYPHPADTPELDWRGEGALVVRPLGAVQHVEVGAAACAFLDACAAGETLAQAAGAALDARPDTDLAHLMAQLLEARAFGQLDLHAPHQRQEIFA